MDSWTVITTLPDGSTQVELHTHTLATAAELHARLSATGRNVQVIPNT
jgi:hypothetical protein